MFVFILASQKTMLSSSKNKKQCWHSFSQNKKQDPFNQHNNASDVKQLKKKKKNNSRFLFFRAFSTLTISLSFSWPASSSQVGGINVCATYKWGWWYVIWPTWLVKKINIYIYIISFKLICFIYIIKRYWISWLKNLNNFCLTKIK